MTKNNTISIIDLLSEKDPIEPETLDRLFPEMTDLEKQRILVIKLIKDTDVVFEDMDVFENAVQVLNDINPDITKTEGVEPEQIWYAVDFITRLRPYKKFSDEVLEYIKFIFKDNGYKFFPPQLELNDDTYKDIVYLATKGPFPLKETKLGIQAAKYLYIQEYIKMKKKKVD